MTGVTIVGDVYGYIVNSIVHVHCVAEGLPKAMKNFSTRLGRGLFPRMSLAHTADWLVQDDGEVVPNPQHVESERVKLVAEDADGVATGLKRKPDQTEAYVQAPAKHSKCLHEDKQSYSERKASKAAREEDDTAARRNEERDSKKPKHKAKKSSKRGVTLLSFDLEEVDLASVDKLATQPFSVCKNKSTSTLHQMREDEREREERVEAERKIDKEQRAEAAEAARIEEERLARSKEESRKRKKVKKAQEEAERVKRRLDEQYLRHLQINCLQKFSDRRERQRNRMQNSGLENLLPAAGGQNKPPPPSHSQSTPASSFHRPSTKDRKFKPGAEAKHDHSSSKSGGTPLHPKGKSSARPNTSSAHPDASSGAKAPQGGSQHGRGPFKQPAPHPTTTLPKPPNPPPRSMISAFNAYQKSWNDLDALSDSTGLTFTTIPWPTRHPPSSPAQLTRVAIEDFLFATCHSEGISKKKRVTAAQLRYHVDKFEGKLFKKVAASERDVVREGVSVTCRLLQEIRDKL